MKKEETLSDIFNKNNYINESVVQKQVSKGEGIEFSYTGELIPVEIVEVAIKDFIKEIKEGIANVQYGETIEETINNIFPIINKHVGEKFK